MAEPLPIVLVVDDSAIDRRVAGAILEEAGYAPRYAEGGEEALVLVETQAPDVVLTDLKMPGMDGLALVEEIRRLPSSPPVILMTAHGSEQIAVAALRAGAAHYVPKTKLRRELPYALRTVLDAARAARDRDLAVGFLATQEAHYVLGYEENGTRALVGHLQEVLTHMRLCAEKDRIRVGTALTEALANAIEHGNLELDSALREAPDDSYYQLRERRMREAPYRDRRVHVSVRLVPDEAVFQVRDEGPGFRVEDLPDPLDPENLTKPSGRGVMLIRTFMDEVRFNECGNQITMVMYAPERSRPPGSS
jgi:CheY-like chemotaxis protein